MRVGVCSGVNNSARTRCSVDGGCIRLAGTGCNRGQVIGGRTAPPVVQAESASAQVSNSAVSIGLRMGLVLFVLRGLRREGVGLQLLGGARFLAGRQLRGRIGSQVLLHRHSTGLRGNVMACCKPTA